VVPAVSVEATSSLLKKLDEAVFAAYGWKSDLSDDEILEKLLATCSLYIPSGASF